MNPQVTGSSLPSFLFPFPPVSLPSHPPLFFLSFAHIIFISCKLTKDYVSSEINTFPVGEWLASQQTRTTLRLLLMAWLANVCALQAKGTSSTYAQMEVWVCDSGDQGAATEAGGSPNTNPEDQVCSDQNVKRHKSFVENLSTPGI